MYRKRQERLKALERVLSASKGLIASSASPNRSDRIKALYELQKAIEEADRLPPHHISLVEKD